MAFEFKYQRRVEFADTDMAGIMHFPRFFDFMEATEHAFFRSLGFSIVTSLNGRSYGWPRLNAECQYKRPLRFEDEVEIQLLVRDKKAKVITYEFIFRKLNAEPVEVVAIGSLTVICVTVDLETGAMKSTDIPAEINRRIEAAPCKTLETVKT